MGKGRYRRTCSVYGKNTQKLLSKQSIHVCTNAFTQRKENDLFFIIFFLEVIEALYVNMLSSTYLASSEPGCQEGKQK